MRTLRSTALLAALILVLSACGRGNEATGGGGAGAGGQESGSAPAAVGSAVPSGPVSGNLTVWAMGTEGDNLQKLADDFMAKYPDVKVAVTPVPWDAAHDKITTAIAGGTAPDVSLVGTTWMGEFAQTGALDPTPSGVDPSKFFQGAWDSTVVQGTSYGVPWYVETRVIYYRKDLAEKAGITDPPATWDDLKALVKGLMDKGGAKYGISLQAGGTGSWQTVMPFVWQAGGGIVDDSGNFTLDSDANVKAYQYYDSFFEDKLTPTALEPGALESGFVDGSIGAFISGPWEIGLVKDQGGEDFMKNVGLAHMPKEQSATSFVGGGDLVVFKTTKNRAAAWQFVDYLTQPDVQAKWYELVNDLPAVKSAWDNDAISGDEFLKVFGDQLNDAKSPPAIPTWEQIANVIDSQMEKVTKGSTAPEDAAKAMQQQATSIGTGF